MFSVLSIELLRSRGFFTSEPRGYAPTIENHQRASSPCLPFKLDNRGGLDPHPAPWLSTPLPRTPERAYLALARAIVIQALDTVLASPVSHWNPVGVSFARSNASQALKRVPPELICQMNPPVPPAFVSSSSPTPALGWVRSPHRPCSPHEHLKGLCKWSTWARMTGNPT